MKNPVFCLLAILFLGGMVRAEDSAKPLVRVSDQARFSRDHVTAELSLHENGKEDWKRQRARSRFQVPLSIVATTASREKRAWLEISASDLSSARPIPTARNRARKANASFFIVFILPFHLQISGFSGPPFAAESRKVGRIILYGPKDSLKPELEYDEIYM